MIPNGADEAAAATSDALYRLALATQEMKDKAERLKAMKSTGMRKKSTKHTKGKTMKVEFATSPHVKFKDGVPVNLEFTVPAGFIYTAIRLSTNPDTTGKRADVTMSLKRGPDVLNTASRDMHGTVVWPDAPGMVTPATPGGYVLTVTASNVTLSDGAIPGDFGCTVAISGLTKNSGYKPPPA